MKILLLTETLHVGGAETFVVRLANELARRNEVLIGVMNGEIAHPGLKGLIAPAVSVEGLLLPGKRWIWRLDGIFRRLGLSASWLRFLQMRWLHALVRKHEPDVIHSHLFKADYLAATVLSTTTSKFRHVITLHGDYAPLADNETAASNIGFDVACATTMRGASAIVGIAKKQLDWITQRYRDDLGNKLHLIYNGYKPFNLDYGAVSRQDLRLPDKFLFGMVARGIESKGWQKAIDAFTSLASHDAALILVGEGPFLDKAVRAGLPDGVIAAGFSSNPIEYIQHFDVGLLPTLFAGESLPTVVIEYLYCGVPVIATDVAEIRAMMKSGSRDEAGWLLTFEDSDISVAELADNMRRCLDDRTSVAAKAALARTAAAKFDMEKCVAAYERLYSGSEDT